MIEAVRRATPILATGIVAVGCIVVGMEIEAKMHPIPVVSAEEIAIGRFQKLTDTTALDSKTGQTCLLDQPSLPPGFTLEKSAYQHCSELAKQ